MFKRPKVVAPPPPPKPAGSGFRSITAGEGRAMANRNPNQQIMNAQTSQRATQAPTPAGVGLAGMSPSGLRDLVQRSPQSAPTSQQLSLLSNVKQGLPLGSKQTPTPPSMASQVSGLGLKRPGIGMKKGGEVKAKKMASGGKVSSASSRGDGCAIKGKTKGRMV
jgi:hypothetical protein